MKKLTRAEEKQASRDEDARRLREGEVTAEELRRQNSFFNPDLPISIDFSSIKSRRPRRKYRK